MTNRKWLLCSILAFGYFVANAIIKPVIKNKLTSFSLSALPYYDLDPFPCLSTKLPIVA